MRLAIGLASGIGNTIFMLPAIKALKDQGHRIELFIQADYPMVELWRRCVYVDGVHDILEPTGDALLVCGQWMPSAWQRRPDQSRISRYQVVYPYPISESDSNMRLAQHFGWTGAVPDVSEWCRDLNRSIRWDVGIVPGGKDGVWLRKRWSGMAAAANHFIRTGAKVAVFGLQSDGVDEIPGDHINTERIEALPDVLAGCRVIIGTDSGIAHLASSLGIPVILVFTATSERKGRPLGPAKIIAADVPCRPCQSLPRWHGCNNWKCGEIDPKSVISAADSLLQSQEKQCL